MNLTHRSLASHFALALAAAATSACGDEATEADPVDEMAELNVLTESNLAEETGPPPMVASSPAYRCDDGDALYVDVLTDENAVNVRDSRADLPTRLTREGGTGPFTGEGRTLSGTGDEISYTAPDRPGQTCRMAEA